MFTGIVVGNRGIWKMTDVAEAAEEKNGSEDEMFSVAETMAPRSGKERQSEAVKKYREVYPDGPYSKMLKRGQLLVVAGALVMLAGMFI